MVEQQFSKLILSLRQASDLKGIHEVCSRLCVNYNFERFIYGARIPAIPDPVIQVITGGHDLKVVQQDEGFWRFDPNCPPSAQVLAHAAWPENESTHEILGILTADTPSFVLESGVSFVVHGEPGEVAVLNLFSATRNAESFTAASLTGVEQFAHYIHEAVRNLSPGIQTKAKLQPLTPREQECIKWTADGKTAWETAKILSITERTVTFHINNAMKKLGAVNRQQAIARAVYYGLIVPR